MAITNIATRSAGPVLLALLLVAAMDASAQAYRPEAFGTMEQAPAHLLGFSPSAVGVLDRERAVDLQQLDALVGKQRVNALRLREGSASWSLYGRVGPINFINLLEPGSDGVQVTLRRNSHGLGGNVYVGFYRRF